MMRELLAVGPQSPPLSPPRLPPLQRKAACTHITLTRLYGSHRCCHCGRIPRCGWVYRCTQDYGGTLPSWEARSVSYDPSQKYDEGERLMSRNDSGIGEEQAGQALRNDDAELKSWIIEAANEGLYTDEQLKLLKAQRRRVADSIREAELSFHLDQAVGRRALAEVTSNSAPNLGSFAFGKSRGHDTSTKSTVSLKMFPDCMYKACSCCR